MFPADPQVPESGHRILEKRRRGIGSRLIGNREQPVNLTWVEAGKTQVEVRLVQLLQLQGEQILVPICPG